MKRLLVVILALVLVGPFTGCLRPVGYGPNSTNATSNTTLMPWPNTTSSPAPNTTAAPLPNTTAAPAPNTTAPGF